MKRKPNKDPEPDFASAVIDQSHVRRIGFEARQFASRMATDMHNLDQLPYGITMRQFQDEATQRLILELQSRIASRKFDSKTVRYPDGAWQCVKDSIGKSSWMGVKIVRRWLKKHPVRYVEVTLEANAYNPTIAIPDHETFVEICINARYRQEGVM